MKRKKVLKSLLISLGVFAVLACVVLYMVLLAPTYSLSKPDDLVTDEQPFVSGMAGVKKFRIPALTTMSDGTFVAACDARWNIPIDSGGLDTVVSTSDNNGESWACTFANYLGDNGNHFDMRSTTFIDPAIICTSEDVLYLATTFYPADVSLKSSPKRPDKTKAFNDNGELLICKGNSGDYKYTLGDFIDGYAVIIDSSSKAVDGYSVDKYFNIYKDGKKKGNLFFKNSPFSVMPTTYIYLNISYDGGKSWESPTLLDVKGDDEEFFGIAPGRGLELDNGRLIFSTYSLVNTDGSTQKSAFIYSDDKGKSWKRAPSLSYDDGWSGESQLVPIDSDTLRCFFRSDNSRMCYSDFSQKEMCWSEPVITDIQNNSNCMISALRCSVKIDGKDVIAVSCPTNPSSRENGKIFIFTVDGNKDMQLFKAIDINEGVFGYSCLSENSDGKLAMLYEVEGHNIIFKNNIEIL